MSPQTTRDRAPAHLGHLAQSVFVVALALGGAMTCVAMLNNTAWKAFVAFALPALTSIIMSHRTTAGKILGRVLYGAGVSLLLVFCLWMIADSATSLGYPIKTGINWLLLGVWCVTCLLVLLTACSRALRRARRQALLPEELLSRDARLEGIQQQLRSLRLRSREIADGIHHETLELGQALKDLEKNLSARVGPETHTSRNSTHRTGHPSRRLAEYAIAFALGVSSSLLAQFLVEVGPKLLDSI